MDDQYFRNRKKNDDTSEIPIIRSEKEILDRLNQQKYEQIIRNQQKNAYYDDDYDYDNSPRRQERQPNRQQNAHGKVAAQPPKKQKAKKKKRRGCGCGTFFIIILLVISLLPVGYIYSLCSKTNYIKSERGLSLPDTNYYNVLLIGCDKSNGSSQRSDSMILVTVDKEHEKIKFTSFMRDLWVSIPGHDDGRLNAAYSYGGAELLMETITENFDIKIDNYVMVDFEMFEQLIDGLGGVTVDITEAEAEFINRTSHAKVHEGENVLDGDYALIYCRIRYLDSDFNRTQRQRKVMSAILQKTVSQNPLKTLSVMSDILPLITTDISAAKMTVKAFSAIGFLKYGSDQFRLPTDNGYSSQYINGQDVLVPDLEENTQALHEFIYN